jgi:lysozyme family protein
MVAATYDAAMIRVFADEGGYTNHPNDPGGPTKYGITIFDVRKYYKSGATAEDVKELPKSVAADIYRKHYATPMRYDDLPAGVDYSVLDAAINSGVGRAPVWLARALNVASKPIGDLVAPAKACVDKVALIKSYWAIRLGFLHSLKTWKTFGLGWGRRCANGEAAAVRMYLAVGAGLPSAEQQKRMQVEAGKAKTSTAAPTIGLPTSDVWSSGNGKLITALVILAAFGLVIYFGRKALIHKYRAEAYAKA